MSTKVALVREPRRVAMHPKMRALRLWLAWLWLADAVLEAMPGVWSKAFYGHLPHTLMPSMLTETLESSHGVFRVAVAMMQSLWNRAPYAANGSLVCVELLLALSLGFSTSRRLTRTTLWVSFVLSVAIWVFGEGGGGLLSLQGTTYYAAFPGGAPFYAVLSYLLLSKKPVAMLQQGVAWLLIAYFGSMAVLQMLPGTGYWTVVGQQNIYGNTVYSSLPTILSNPIAAYGEWAGLHPVFANVLLILLLLLAGGCVLYRRRIFSFYIFAAILLWTWWFAFAFGGIFTGLSTDVGTPPLLFILGLFIWRGELLKSEHHSAQSTKAKG